MSKQGVKLVIAALLSNPHFQKAFFADPKKTLDDCAYQLTPIEKRALIRIKKKDIDMRIIGGIRGKIMKIIPPRILP